MMIMTDNDMEILKNDISKLSVICGMKATKIAIYMNEYRNKNPKVSYANMGDLQKVKNDLNNILHFLGIA